MMANLKIQEVHKATCAAFALSGDFGIPGAIAHWRDLGASLKRTNDNRYKKIQLCLTVWLKDVCCFSIKLSIHAYGKQGIRFSFFFFVLVVSFRFVFLFDVWTRRRHKLMLDQETGVLQKDVGLYA